MAAAASVSPSSKRRKVVKPRVALAAALPDEMVTEVLLRLPIKSILRFRAVSRAWATLLSSKDFCDLHMTAVSAAPPKLLFVSPTANFASTAVYSCSTSPPSRGRGHNDDEPLLVLPDARGNFVEVAPAPCHGLTLLYDAVAPAHYACAGAGARAVTAAYYVLNAATRAVTRLPPCEEVSYATAGIGFDARAKEYKVVRLFQGGLLDDEHFKCQVYTLGGGEDRWRPVDRGVPFRFCKFARSAIVYAACKKVHPVFVDGFLHWLVDPECFDNKPRAAVISFSLTSETFSWVRSPPFSVSGAHLVELDGYLCMVREIARGWPRMLEIWKLKDYSSGEWSLNHRVTLSGHHNMAITGEFVEAKAVRVIGSFGDSKCSERIIIATSRHKVFAWDPMSGTLETIHSTMEIQTHQTEPCEIRFSLFRETLVPVPKTEEEMALSSPMSRATKEILLRLPAKSVLNFKLVCKQWLRLIRTESFSRAYFSHNNIDKRLKIMLVGKGSGDGEPDFSFIPLNKWLHQQAPDQSTFLDTKVVCSKPCHGLNLISTETMDYLYNPCLGFRRIYSNERHVLHRSWRVHPDSVQSEEHLFTVGNKNVGLGFNPLTQEHVIVLIFYDLKNYKSREYNLLCSVWFCNNRDGQIIPPPPLPVSDMPPAYLEGMLYWMSEPRLGQSQNHTIVSYNIATGVFDVIPCPSRIARWNSARSHRSFVAELEGVLCAVLSNPVRDEMCIWKWEHGHWNISYTICLKSCPDYSLGTNIVVPLAIDPTDGRILLSTGRRLGLYDPLKQEVENYIALDEMPLLESKEKTLCPGDGGQKMQLYQPSSSSIWSWNNLSHSIDQSKEESNEMSRNLWPLVPMLYEENLAYYPAPARARILQWFPSGGFYF